MPEQSEAFDPLRDRLQALFGNEYEVVRRLGAGGMGYVYVAREPGLARSVAIKILRPELATARAAERFQREAQLLAAVEHPSVVTIHRVGHEQGLYYFVMELLGGTLADRLRQGPLPEPEGIRLGRDLLDGLARVHDAGIIHRDIKPSNIFLQEGKPAKLGDFGIAHSEHPSAVHLTAPGEPSPGTPGYMAPEQWAQEDAGPSADLYAVGLVLYEALTGRRWKSGTPPDRGDWTGVRGRTRTVLQRALALDPARRWPDARGFGRALAATQRDTRPAWLVVAATPIVAALVYVLASILWPPRAHPPTDVAVLPFAVEGEAADEGEVLAMFVELHLGRAFGDSGLRVTPLTTSRAWAAGLRDTAAPVPATAWDSLNTRHLVRGTVRVTGDSLELTADLVTQDGNAYALGQFRGLINDEIEIGHRVAAEFVRQVRGCTTCFHGVQARGRTAEAWTALVDAEYAFQHDNWSVAEAYYRKALDLDSSLAPAQWGLFNVRRWQRATTDADVAALAAVYTAHAGEFGELDRLLISADIAPTVPERLAIYDTAIGAFPYDAYPRLLRGNELFHRGALVGKGLDSAVAALEFAAAGRPFASTFSMLTWAHTRRGDSAKAEASLGAYESIASEQPIEDFRMGGVLRLAWAMRFLPSAQSQRMLQDVLRGPDGPASLARAVRLALAFGVPRAQLTIGEFLALLPDPEAKVQGLTTQALALLALGRVSESAERLEAAAAQSGDDEYAFQARQWRLVFPTLDVPGLPTAGREEARAAMVQAAERGPRQGRARWTLVLDAIETDTTRASLWLARLGEVPGAGALHAIGTALLQAARGDTVGALRLSDSLALHTLVADLADPLHRVVLYLSRGNWLAGRDPAAADAAWRWYENADLVGWPAGYPQAAEVDWAFEAFAAWRRANLALAHGDVRRACALVPTVSRYWSQGGAPYTRLADRLRTSAGACVP